jgi:hypothetical protein
MRAINRVWMIVGSLVVVAGFGWGGSRLQPVPFASVTQSSAPPTMMPLPSQLPAPVERFYRQLYGSEIPVIQTAIISGRGTMRIQPLFNMTLPVRFRFVHEAGRNYRHYIEVTFWGLPVLKVNEYFVDGKERQELPWAVMTGNPKLDQGGNLGMWAEILQWLPAALLTDPAVHWEAVDDETAWLVVPFNDGVERFLVRFDPTNDKVKYWEVMRYANGEGDKSLWINGTWFDDGRPWFIVLENTVVYNVVVDTTVATRGP